MTTSTQSATQIVVPRALNGPPRSGHGGASAGIFAVATSLRSASVRFRTPIPLATDLAVRCSPGLTTITDGEAEVATVRPLTEPLSVRPFARLDRIDIIRAEARFLDHHNGEHMAPTCFACGDQRTDADGLGLRPGVVAGTDLVATSWRPNQDSDVPTWLIWAALDCPTGLPALAEVALDEAVVTGELNVEIRSRVPGRGNYQIIGRRISRDGRKFTTEAALIDERSHALAVATATWIVVPKSSLRHAQEAAIAV